jgi:alpha/beta superfamily hydrolase
VVQRGEFLERATVIACGELSLDGLYHRGERGPAVLICPPTGPGGGMDAPPVEELAWACAQASLPSLRFQHRGVGASTGAADPSAALQDARAALEHLQESGGVARLGVAGVGSGCATALALARSSGHVQALVLAAPAEPPDLTGLVTRTLVLVPEHGGLAMPALEHPSRVEVVPEADPLFRRGLPALGRAAVAFLGQR